jgi:two-component sensor histidine kinase
VWVPLVFGVLFALSSLWRSPVAGWIQVFVLLAASILSSLTSHIGELTSSLFLIFGIVLVFELRLPRIPSGVVTAISLIAYPLALSVGYAKFGPATAVRTIESILVVTLFVVLYGGILYRHWLQHREEAELLERRVVERTAELQSALDERSAMMQEIHHRVKNNLQIIASLLHLEAQKAGDEGVKASSENSIRRIHAMALVHETLYQSKPLHEIHLEHYVSKLIRELQDTLSAEYSIGVEVAGSSVVDPDFAIPFGLLLSELIANALQHAFPGRHDGKVAVSLSCGDRIGLTVSDNGVGMSRASGGEQPREGLGLRIVQSLVTQLSGSIESDSCDQGTTWQMSFPRSGVRETSAPPPGRG